LSTLVINKHVITVLIHFWPVRSLSLLFYVQSQTYRLPHLWPYLLQ